MKNLLAKEAPRAWGILPNAVKQHIFREASRTTPQVMSGLVSELQQEIDECLDLEGLVVRTMSEDIELSNNMFIQCADAELAFIRNSGAWMGFVFGLGQMALSMAFSQWWLLPAVGLVAGASPHPGAPFAVLIPAFPCPLYHTPHPPDPPAHPIPPFSCKKKNKN